MPTAKRDNARQSCFAVPAVPTAKRDNARQSCFAVPAVSVSSTKSCKRRCIRSPTRKWNRNRCPIAIVATPDKRKGSEADLAAQGRMLSFLSLASETNANRGEWTAKTKGLAFSLINSTIDCPEEEVGAISEARFEIFDVP